MNGRRTIRAIGYFLLFAAGVAALIWPAPSVRAATSPTSGLLVYLWAGLLALGGLCSAIGAVTDRWLGEYAGLWPLVTTFMVYGLAAFTAGRGSASYAGGLFLLSIAALLYARWQDVALIRREAIRQVGEQ
jgi:hypothetical protein